MMYKAKQNHNTQRLSAAFFERDVLEVAPLLLGKIIVRRFDNGEVKRYRISETEAYRGTDDLACHASKGRTPRTEVMYGEAGLIYVYLIYGMYWLLNFVTSEKDYPAAVLIRSLDSVQGPGRVGRELQLDKSFNAQSLLSSGRLWVEDDGFDAKYNTDVRIGVDYAAEWAKKPWRFILQAK
jgi:DNA-3-methyladenine glycosylase